MPLVWCSNLLPKLPAASTFLRLLRQGRRCCPSLTQGCSATVELRAYREPIMRLSSRLTVRAHGDTFGNVRPDRCPRKPVSPTIERVTIGERNFHGRREDIINVSVCRN